MGAPARASRVGFVAARVTVEGSFAAFGWAAGLLSATYGLPQALRIRRLGTASGVSLPMWQVVFLSGCAFSIYGVRTDRMEVVAPNVVMAVVSGSVLALVRRQRGTQPLRVWFPPIIGAVIAVVGHWLFGELAFTAVLAGPVLSSRGAQLLLAWRAPDIAGISTAAFALQALAQLLWLVYAVGVGAAAIIVLGLPALITSTGTWLLAGQRR